MKSIINVFPQPKWINSVSCDGKPCGSGSKSCSSDSNLDSNGGCHSSACGDSQFCDFTGLVKWFGDKYKDLVEVKIADYSTPENIFNSLDDLNNILKLNCCELIVSLDNLELVFSQISLIVAINNSLAFVGKTPTESDLLEAIKLYCT